MKVHKFQIDVMWLFIAVSFIKPAYGQMNGFEKRTIRPKGIRKEPYSPIQIRPPP